MRSRNRIRRTDIPAVRRWLLGLIALAAASASAAASPAADDEILTLLRKGGCYVVMRHASSPREVPSAGRAVPGNTTNERQLDDEGRRTARELGEALRKLGVPVTTVLSSPTWRALETAAAAGLPPPMQVAELGDGGTSMASAGASQAEWLRRQVSRPPARGNTVVITHAPNLRAAFPEQATDMADGEALIVVPRGNGRFDVAGRIPIGEWPRLANLRSAN